jgi:hypothetical protein
LASVKPIDADTARRLALIRLLLARAKGDSRLPVPYSFDSVNRLHDVAEMFLALAAQHSGVPIPKEFTEYWPKLGVPLGRPLAYAAQMQKFNKVRVNLKHYGIEPSPTDIDAGRLAVHGLLTDECPNLFGIALDDVSLSNFVTSVKARSLLDSAEANWPASPAEAFADLWEAFRDIIHDYETRKALQPHKSIFDAIDFSRLVPPTQGFAKAHAQFERGVLDALLQLDYNVMIVGLGVDLRRYGKFKSLMPAVDYMIASSERLVRDHPGLTQREQQDFEFCRDFVIQTAIHLAEFDYDFDLWGTYQAKVRKDLVQYGNDVRSRVGLP